MGLQPNCITLTFPSAPGSLFSATGCCEFFCRVSIRAIPFDLAIERHILDGRREQPPKEDQTMLANTKPCCLTTSLIDKQGWWPPRLRPRRTQQNTKPRPSRAASKEIL